MKVLSVVVSVALAGISWCFQRPLHSDSVLSSSVFSLHRSLVEIPSISGAEADVSSFLARYLRSRGFQVVLQPVAPGRHNVFAHVGANRSRVLLTSHLDTVPPFFPYERRGDDIWGRGSVDAKASVAAQVAALEALVAAGEAGEGDAALLFVVGEENGSGGMAAANRLGLAWDAVVFGEPTELKLGRGHKGGLGFEISARGLAGHSGYPDAGRSAVDILVRALTALSAVDLPHSDDYGPSTLNVGLIRGGVAANVIAENASASVHVRIAAGEPETLWREIRQTLANVSPYLDLTYRSGRGPVPLDYDIDGFDTTVLSYGTDVPNLEGDHKRYLYGPGSILVAHSDHEHLAVSDLEEAVQGYTAIIRELLGRKVRGSE